MYDMNTILAAMAEGKTADDLAKEFTDALNAANAKIEADRIAAEKAAAEAKAKSEKVTAFKNIMIDIIDFVNTYYADQMPSEVVEALNGEIKDETVAEVVDEIDNLIKMTPMVLALINAEKKSSLPKSQWVSFKPTFKIADSAPKRAEKPTIKTITPDEANKIIHDFLGQILKCENIITRLKKPELDFNTASSGYKFLNHRQNLWFFFL